MNGDVVELQLGAGGGSSDGAVKANRVNSVVRLTCRQQRELNEIRTSNNTKATGKENPHDHKQKRRRYDRQ